MRPRLHHRFAFVPFAVFLWWHGASAHAQSLSNPLSLTGEWGAAPTVCPSTLEILRRTWAEWTNAPEGFGLSPSCSFGYSPIWSIVGALAFLLAMGLTLNLIKTTVARHRCRQEGVAIITTGRYRFKPWLSVLAIGGLLLFSGLASWTYDPIIGLAIRT